MFKWCCYLYLSLALCGDMVLESFQVKREYRRQRHKTIRSFPWLLCVLTGATVTAGTVKLLPCQVGMKWTDKIIHLFHSQWDIWEKNSTTNKKKGWAKIRTIRGYHQIFLLSLRRRWGVYCLLIGSLALQWIALQYGQQHHFPWVGVRLILCRGAWVCACFV